VCIRLRKRIKMSDQEAEAIKHIKDCLKDLTGPTRQSLKRRRRTVAWLAYCAAELERMVNEKGGSLTSAIFDAVPRNALRSS